MNSFVKISAVLVIIIYISGHPASSHSYLKGNLTSDEKVVLRRTARGKLMRSYMNANTDPCATFYEYSCGNWKSINQPPSIFDENDVFRHIERRIENQSLKLIREPSGQDYATYSEVANKIRTYYRSCEGHNFTTIVRSQVKINLLDGLFGPYIFTPAWSAADFDWLGIIARMQTFGANAFIYESVSKEFGAPMVYIKSGVLKLPGIDISDMLFQSNDLHEKIRSSILAKRYGDIDKKLLEDVATFAIKLNTLALTNEKNESTSVLSLDELIAKVPVVDWNRYFTILLGNSLNFSMKLIVDDVNYFHHLDQLLRKFQPETIAAYLALHFLDHLQENVSVSKHSIDKYCSMRVLEDMPQAIYAFHMNKFNITAVKPEVLQMAKSLRHHYNETIIHFNWNDRLKSLAMNKLGLTQLEIGYPDSIRSSDQLDKIYKGLTIDLDNFELNFLHCLEFKTRSMHNKLLPLMATDIDLNFSLMDIKPRYDPITNRITIPAGILVPPIYHQQLPMAFKIGSLGSLVVNAYTEVINTVYGQVAEKEDEEALKDLSKCLLLDATHNSFPGLIGADQVGKNGSFFGAERQSRSIFEPIGVILGSHISLSTYIEWKKDNEELDDILPGLNVTSQQLLFLSFAQSQCGDNEYGSYFTSDESERILGRKQQIVNLLGKTKDFSTVYNCNTPDKINCLQI